MAAGKFGSKSFGMAQVVLVSPPGRSCGGGGRPRSWLREGVAWVELTVSLCGWPDGKEDYRTTQVGTRAGVSVELRGGWTDVLVVRNSQVRVNDRVLSLWTIPLLLILIVRECWC